MSLLGVGIKVDSTRAFRTSVGEQVRVFVPEVGFVEGLAIGFVLQNIRGPTLFAFFRLVHWLPADLGTPPASGGGEQTGL
jgi:hypothetical protein